MRPVKLRALTPSGNVEAIHTSKARIHRAIIEVIQSASRHEISCTLVAEIDNLTVILWRSGFPPENSNFMLLKYLPLESKNA